MSVTKISSLETYIRIRIPGTIRVLARGPDYHVVFFEKSRKPCTLVRHLTEKSAITWLEGFVAAMQLDAVRRYHDS